MTARRTMIIAGAAALAVAVLWYLVLWSPRKAELDDAREQREASESERQELATRVGRLRAAQKDEPMKRARLETLRTTIPDDPNLAAFILDTNDAAAKAGIEWISVAPEEPSPGAPSAASVAAAPVTTTAGDGTGATTAANRFPAEIGLQLQIQGGYFQILDFLNRLNEMPRLVVTDGLNISSDDKANPRHRSSTVESALASSPGGITIVSAGRPGSTATGTASWVTRATRRACDGSTAASSCRAPGPTRTS